MYFSIIKMSYTARKYREFWNKTKEESSLYSLFSELFYKELKKEKKFNFRPEFESCYPSFFAVSEKKPDDNSEKWKIISNEYEPYFNKR